MTSLWWCLKSRRRRTQCCQFVYVVSFRRGRERCPSFAVWIRNCYNARIQFDSLVFQDRVSTSLSSWIPVTILTFVWYWGSQELALWSLAYEPIMTALSFSTRFCSESSATRNSHRPPQEFAVYPAAGFQNHQPSLWLCEHCCFHQLFKG